MKFSAQQRHWLCCHYSGLSEPCFWKKKMHYIQVRSFSICFFSLMPYHANEQKTYSPDTRVILKTCCTVAFAFPSDIFRALSKLDAIWYMSLSCAPDPSNGMYMYGKTPWTCKHVFFPAKGRLKKLKSSVRTNKHNYLRC